MHDVHKIAVDVTFAQIKSKKGINRHIERAIWAMNKDYMQL